MIDIVAALIITQAYVGLNPPNYDAMAADVTGDDAVNIIDALCIAQYYVGLIVSLPGCAIPVDRYVTFSISDNLFDSSQPDTLGLVEATGTETIPVFTAVDNTDHYSNGAALIPFKDKLYIMWQSSAADEETADTWVAYSSSTDGVNWEAPARLEVNSNGSHFKTDR